MLIPFSEVAWNNLEYSTPIGSLRCQSIAGLPPAWNSLEPTWKPGWREALGEYRNNTMSPTRPWAQIVRSGDHLLLFTGLIMWIDHCKEIWKLTFECSNEELMLKTSAFESLYGGQFTLSTNLINQIILEYYPPMQHHSLFGNLTPLYSLYQESTALTMRPL